ncbi:MAG: response regulator transcription factor [Magnetospirillum sp.]|nr:response regulator transcription factor [Magnetospirillum sp.]
MSSSRRLLLIADDPVLRQILSEHLASAGFAIAIAAGTAAAPPGARDADLAVLDGDGALALCRRLKADDPSLPVMILAGHRVDSAADAVMVKPVRLAALVAKLEDLLNRKDAGIAVRIGEWRFDPHARALDGADGRQVRLTDKETAILRCLGKAGGVVARERLLAEVWGYAGGVSTHTLETHIYRLRRKLEPDPGRASVLVTEAGGYRLVT